MANLIQKTILHPENSKEIDLYPKTSYEQVEGLDGIIAGIDTKIDNIHVGEMVLFSYPKGATNGNITDWQLSKLQENTSNYINMVNDKELYYLNDLGHVEDYLTYSHVGIENGKATIKTLTITVSAKSFVIVTTVIPTDAGGKLYRHDIKLTKEDSSGPPTFFTFNLLLTDNTPITKENAHSIFSKLSTNNDNVGWRFTDAYIYPTSPVGLFAISVNVSNNNNTVTFAESESGSTTAPRTIVVGGSATGTISDIVTEV